MLIGKLIALSMSESTDIQQSGLDALYLENAMVELSRFLLINCATLAYGGHLGPRGYTQKLFELVRTHNDLAGVAPFVRIVNHRGWPLPQLSVVSLAEVHQVSRAIELPRPADVDEIRNADFLKSPEFFSGDESPQDRYARVLGMTEMREFQTNYASSKVFYRIVIGGTFGPTVKVDEDGSQKETWYSGRIPGVLGEILLSDQAGQPVFLIGAYGGVARLVIDLLLGNPRPEATWEYQSRAPHAPAMRALYEKRGPAWWDYPDMIQFLRYKGIAGINGLLTEPDHGELFETIDPVRMVEFVLSGINRLKT